MERIYYIDVTVEGNVITATATKLRDREFNCTASVEVDGPPDLVAAVARMALFPFEEAEYGLHGDITSDVLKNDLNGAVEQTTEQWNRVPEKPLKTKKK